MSWWPFGKKEKSTQELSNQVDAISGGISQQAETKDTSVTIHSGLTKSASGFNDRLKNIFVRKRLDDEMLQELEDSLILSDMGAHVAHAISSQLAKEKFDKDVNEIDVKRHIADYITRILKPLEKPLNISSSRKPHVILMCGVNGTGKTTSIGKMAYQYTQEGKKVMIAACDTFRAAATEQLIVWAERAGVTCITGVQGADPASVAYEAIEKAKQTGVDILMIDTAGRLHNKKNLMEELAKIIRVIKKVDESAPHDTIMVLDATTGQNAISQTQTFKEIVDISGIIINKLDGTAKGGIVVALSDKFKLPIHAIGIGEQLSDLKTFHADEYANAIIGL